MPSVISVRIRNMGAQQYISPGKLDLKPGDDVIIPTGQGLEYATVVQAPHEMDEADMPQPMHEALRLANDADRRQLENNLRKETQAFAICRERIAAHKLDMKLVSVAYTFDNTKLLASFTSAGRVDFRALVKDLASIFKTRIELRQIGVRDEARIIGGIGSCGRGLCCANFLYEFQPVSIRMAKDQSLSLNPTKISGMCGRLMCCLKYEQTHYEKARKKLPKLGKEVITPLGRGTVTQVNALLETVSVRIVSGENTDIHQFSAEQVQRPVQQRTSKEHPGREVTDIVVDEIDEEFIGTPESDAGEWTLSADED
ncbi:MAG TPA: stage 0 sporulation family protein [Clostridia bacterium]|mgnify:CR=1 FL=1|jgi:cell fate regulator YaaT (PSP1 superfamily)|nr:stage 0 sporulation family protein [Clostridia bacterium]HPY43153.1 stage 0 sporulation family protein [Clostridia bacterium]HQA96390.1 stage 0 sporulation family protein [Clostridia bacterium]HQO55955.1 stage 0 sporulation family protein [Clostridia bacterium]HUM60971.1 stage 0 sporulation family protein [Clostridia bacterium]